MRPGLTGWAQVNGGRKLTPEEKVALDIWYVRHVSLLLDVRIAMRTIALVFSGEKLDQRAVLDARSIRPDETAKAATLIAAKSKMPAQSAA